MRISTHRSGRFGGTLGQIVAEFLVIVVGVLVALAVDEYMTIRDEQDRVELYLERLTGEFATMSENLNREMERYDDAFATATEVINGVTLTPVAPQDSLDAWISGLFPSIEWQPELIVLNTMVATGDISLIEDPAVQDDLIRFREQSRVMEDHRALADEMIMEGFRSLSATADFLVWGPALFSTTPTGDRWPWAELATDVTFRNGIYSAANGVRNHRMALASFATELERVRSALRDKRP